MDDAAGTYDWLNLVRRARLGRQTKTVCFALASYANPDGSNIRPGVARLAYECELGYSTVKKELATIRRCGLIRKTGQLGDVDIYRLVIAVNVLELLDLPTPAQADLAIADIRVKARGKYKASAQKALRDERLRLATVAAAQETKDRLRLPQESRRTPDENNGCGYIEEPQATAAATETIGCGSPEIAATTHYQNTTPTNHPVKDLRTAVTLSRASDREQPDPTPPTDLVTRPRCPHGRSTRRRNDGHLRCPECDAQETTTPAIEQPPARPLTVAEKARLEAREAIAAAQRRRHPERPQPGEPDRHSHAAAIAAIDHELAAQAAARDTQEQPA